MTLLASQAIPGIGRPVRILTTGGLLWKFGSDRAAVMLWQAGAMTVNTRWAKPTLVGELVTLRPFEPADVEGAWEMLHDPAGADLTATSARFTREQIEEWYATRDDQDQRLDLAIIENSTGEFVGEAVLNEWNSASDSANFRIALRGPAWFGRGLGGEATHLVVEHGLRTIGLKAITLGVLVRNPRARRAYERSGFVVTREYVEDGEAWLEMEIAAGLQVRRVDPRHRCAQRMSDALWGEIQQRYGFVGPHPFDPDSAVESNGGFWLALDGGTPVGSIALVPAAGESTTGRRGEVDVMYVVPSHRRRGIARLLLAALEDHARERGTDELVLRAGDPQPEALAFYAAHGFTPTQPFGHWTQDPTAICLRKHL